MFNIDKILNAQIGDLDNKIKVEFKRTVQAKQYETEAVTAAVEVNVSNLDGADRSMIYTLLEAQAEYTVMVNLTLKGLISQQEYDKRVKALETYVNQMSAKYTAITGKDAEQLYVKAFNSPNNYNATHTQNEADSIQRVGVYEGYNPGPVGFMQIPQTAEVQTASNEQATIKQFPTGQNMQVGTEAQKVETTKEQTQPAELAGMPNSAYIQTHVGVAQSMGANKEAQVQTVQPQVQTAQPVTFNSQSMSQQKKPVYNPFAPKR